MPVYPQPTLLPPEFYRGRTSARTGGGHRFARPARELRRALEHVERHSVVPHRAAAAPVGPERGHPCRLVIGAARIVDFEIESVPCEEAEEHAGVIQADTAEHTARRDVAELLELIENEPLECVADLQRPQPFRWRATRRSIASGHARMLLRNRAVEPGPDECPRVREALFQATGELVQDRDQWVDPIDPECST